MREGGSIAVGIDRLRTTSDLAARADRRTVYVTVSAARSPQEEARQFLNPAPLPNGQGDTIWLCTGAATRAPTRRSTRLAVPAPQVVNGDALDEHERALVLTFTRRNWSETANQTRLRLRRRRPALRGRPRRRRPAQRHLRPTPRFDGALVRNVEVTVYDNDTPGVFVTQIEKSAVCPGPTCDRGQAAPSSSRATASTADCTDELLVQLARHPSVGDTIVVAARDRRRQPAGDLDSRI